jgi:hypothetical protein
MPEVLRSLATDIASWAEKLGCRSDLRDDALARNHDLIDWPEHSPLVLEVSGKEGEWKLEGFRVEGRRVDEYLKESLWSEAEEYLCGENKDRIAWHKEAHTTGTAED